MRFSIDDPKFDLVAAALLSRGWIRHKVDCSSKAEFDLMWTNLAKVDFQAVFDNNLIVNHVKGSQHMSNKVIPIRQASLSLRSINHLSNILI
jgi:hypothetical protein